MIYGTAWKKERTAALVAEAVANGFRGIDTACQPKHYDEPGVGAALAATFAGGSVRRQDLWLQTKYTAIAGQDPARVPYDPESPVEQQVEQSLACSLRNLGVDYLDCVLLHSPLPTHEATMAAWRVLEAAVQAGTVLQLGISNLSSLAQLQAIHADAVVKPAVVQQRFHAATGFERPMRAWCAENSVGFQSFWTLSANDKPGQPMQQPAFLQLAQARGCTPQELMYRYCMSVGITPLNGTTSVAHMQQGVALLGMERLAVADTALIDSLLGEFADQVAAVLAAQANPS